MSIMRNKKIAKFQERAGIEPAMGSRAEALDALSRTAFELIKIIELERSGIREGDGYWSGCDAFGHVVDDMAQHCKTVLQMDGARTAPPKDAV